jgi:hypothetical protein
VPLLQVAASTVTVVFAQDEMPDASFGVRHPVDVVPDGQKVQTEAPAQPPSAERVALSAKLPAKQPLVSAGEFVVKV